MIGCATGLEMDRQARIDPSIAPFVPEIFRRYAAEALAIDALQRGDPQLGVRRAYTLVERRPIPAEGLSLLARGYLLQGNEAKALPVLTLAAQRGWRDTFIQPLLANIALTQGEPQLAAQRLAALWRLDRKDVGTLPLTRALLLSPGGPDALTAQMQPADNWVNGVLVWAMNDGLPAPALTPLVRAMTAKGIPANCGALSDADRKFARSGNAQAAVMIWNSLCADGQKVTGADDFSFTQTSEQGGPFDWLYPMDAGLSSELVGGPNGMSLQYENTEYSRSVVARRVAALAPGTHTIALDAQVQSESRDVIVQISCFSPEGKSQDRTRFPLTREPVMFQIRAGTCAGQEIMLLVGKGAGRINRLIVS